MNFSEYLHFKFYKMINVVWFIFKNWYLPRKQKDVKQIGTDLLKAWLALI